MMYGGITFRDAINNNKKFILEYLSENGMKCTRDICNNYKGEKEMPAVRKALNELRMDGKIITDDHVHMWQGKFWSIVSESKEDAVNPSIRELSLEWFFGKSEVERKDLKGKHFPDTPIEYSKQWGYHFTFGQIEEMYKKEHQ